MVGRCRRRSALAGRYASARHRVNQAQTAPLLPAVEDGIRTLIGATTENPSLELTSALLSRCRVFVLEPLTVEQILTVLNRALDLENKGKGEKAGVRFGEA